MPDEPRKGREAPNELKRDLERFCEASRRAQTVAKEIAFKGPSPEFSAIAMVLEYIHWKIHQPDLFDPDAILSTAAEIAIDRMGLDRGKVWYHEEAKTEQVH